MERRNTLAVILIVIVVVAVGSFDALVLNNHTATPKITPAYSMTWNYGEFEEFRNAAYYYNFSLNATANVSFDWQFTPLQVMDLTESGWFLLSFAQFISEIPSLAWETTPPQYLHLLGNNNTFLLPSGSYSIVFVIYGQLQIQVTSPFLINGIAQS